MYYTARRLPRLLYHGWEATPPVIPWLGGYPTLYIPTRGGYPTLYIPTRGG